MKKTFVIMVAFLVFFSLPYVSAREMSYSQVTLGYASAEEEVGAVSVDGDGFGFTGTYELNDSIFVGIGYSSLDYDLSVANITVYGVNLGGSVAFDVEATSFGAGFHTPISDTEPTRANSG